MDGASCIRFTRCASNEFYATNLPIFFIFKGNPGDSIDKLLPSILPSGFMDVCNKGVWMNDRAIQIWYDAIWNPNVHGRTDKSILHLDDLKCYKQPSFTETLFKLNTMDSIVPNHYTSVLQLCDVRINKPLKDRLKKMANN